MRNDRSPFHYFIGILAVAGGATALMGLYFIEVPAGNRDALMFGLGIITGWGSIVIGYEFGDSRSKPAQDVVVTNKATDPVPTTTEENEHDKLS